MPLRTVWVREDDLESFEAIPNRPEWLHAAITLAVELAKTFDDDES